MKEKMDNEKSLLEFFSAENKRDWTRYKTFLHPCVEWILFSDSKRQITYGIGDYMDKMRSAYGKSEDSFICEKMITSCNGQRILAILVNNHGHRSIDIFDFENGLIRNEYEFLMG
jgi:hypothetical protein